jgi:hypothetical protein
MSARKVTEMTRNELAEAIYSEAHGDVDSKAFHTETVWEIMDWLEYGAPPDEDDTVATLAAGWLDYNNVDEVYEEAR